jgi:hypothetical protein
MSFICLWPTSRAPRSAASMRRCALGSHCMSSIKTPMTCAFCGRPGQMTKQHIWPKWLKKIRPSTATSHTQVIGEFMTFSPKTLRTPRSARSVVWLDNRFPAGFIPTDRDGSACRRRPVRGGGLLSAAVEALVRGKSAGHQAPSNPAVRCRCGAATARVVGSTFIEGPSVAVRHLTLKGGASCFNSLCNALGIDLPRRRLIGARSPVP